MFGKSLYFRFAGMVLLVAALSACAGRPDAIVADDEALCQFSAAAPGGFDYAQCRDRLRSTRVRSVAASASRIEGYALLNTPAQPADVAGRCTTPEGGSLPGAKNCEPGDVTGTIRPDQKR